MPGSSVLMGTELGRFFDNCAGCVLEIDLRMRAELFGSRGGPTWKLDQLDQNSPHFSYHHFGIRVRKMISPLLNFSVSRAAQFSHDHAARRPLDGFDAQTTGTLKILEDIRHYSHDAVLTFPSIDETYGERPNQWLLGELDRSLAERVVGTWNNRTLTVSKQRKRVCRTHGPGQVRPIREPGE